MLIVACLAVVPKSLPGTGGVFAMLGRIVLSMAVILHVNVLNVVDTTHGPDPMIIVGPDVGWKDVPELVGQVKNTGKYN